MDCNGVCGGVSRIMAPDGCIDRVSIRLNQRSIPTKKSGGL